MGRPLKTSRVDNRSAHRDAVAAHELGQCVHDDIRAMFDRLQENGCRDGIIDDKGQPARVS